MTAQKSNQETMAMGPRKKLRKKGGKRATEFNGKVRRNKGEARRGEEEK